jgi:hypothetical protein
VGDNSSGCTPIWIQDDDGLENTVILGAGWTGANESPCNLAEPVDAWIGPVTIGSTPLVYEPGSGSDPDIAPYYARPSSDLGAMGLVPFRLYENDCVPPHTDDWSYSPTTGNELLNSQFCRRTGVTPKEIRVRFYGPVATGAAGTTGHQPVTLWVWLHNQFWWDVTDLVNVKMAGISGSSSVLTTPREIVIYGKGNSVPMLPSGFYAVVTLADDPSNSERVYSDQTFATPAPGLTGNAASNSIMQYNFELFPDCDQDDDLDTSTSCGPCIADYDDGTGDCEATPPVVHPDGGVGIEDLLFYLCLYDQGHSLADVDDGSSTGTPDLGVGIEDLLYYMMRYDLGC